MIIIINININLNNVKKLRVKPKKGKTCDCNNIIINPITGISNIKVIICCCLFVCF